MPAASRLAALVAVVGLVAHARAQGTEIYPSPTDIAGTGPRPPAITASAAVGTWAPPASSDGLPPPSLTGMGRQGHINGPDDFCIYMPPDPTTQNLVDAEPDAVAYCFNPVNDTRPFPDGFIKTAHFRRTSDYVQISGTFDWTKMNLNPYDCGGEYDNHGPGGVGNPVGAHLDGGQDWMQFQGSCDTPGVGQFCLRSCNGPSSYDYCKNTYDLMGCLWVMPSDYQQEGFTSCEADTGGFVGVYNSSYTFAQGQSYTPPAKPAPSSSMCSTTTSPAALGVTYPWLQTGYATNPIEAAVASPTAASDSSSSSTAAATSSSAPASSAGRPPASGTGSGTALPAATGSNTPASAATALGVGRDGWLLAAAWTVVIAGAVGVGAGVAA